MLLRIFTHFDPTSFYDWLSIIMIPFILLDLYIVGVSMFIGLLDIRDKWKHDREILEKVRKERK